MTDRPILFSAPMVRAILDGRKTQTRRIVKGGEMAAVPFDRIPSEEIESLEIRGWREYVKGHLFPSCPYGQPGDRLWVRETHYRFGHWEAVASVRTKTGRQKWAFVPDSTDVLFDAPPEFRKGRHHKDPFTQAWHKRLARFMPKNIVRITLEITDVQVERLQDISEADAVAEGSYLGKCECFPRPRNPVESMMKQTWCHKHGDEFISLWKKINGPESWNANPWVWVIEFKRVKP